jgi:ATP-dependent DNA helicase RecQ
MHGVGAAKMAKYGHDFMAEIKDYVAAHPECLEQSETALPAVTKVVRPVKEKTGGSTETIQATISCVEQGQTLDAIATERGLKLTTISSHVESYLAEGHGLNIDHLLNPEQQQKIETSFTIHGTNFLKPVVEEVDVSYEQAKIIRGLLKGREISALLGI